MFYISKIKDESQKYGHFIDDTMNWIVSFCRKCSSRDRTNSKGDNNSTW